MKLENVIKSCKKHGLTSHGIYLYDKGTSCRCLQCVKETRAERRKNSDKNQHDLEYIRQWTEKNQDQIKIKAKIKHRENYANRILGITDFFDLEEAHIQHLCICLESSLSMETIKNHCVRRNVFSIDDVKKYILSNKRSELYNTEGWGRSSLLKYQLGVRESYINLSEFEKTIIRKNYKSIAKIIVNQKIEKLLQKI